jgi:hypothetical protein
MTKPEITPEGHVVITNTKDENHGKLVAMTYHTDMSVAVIGDGDGSEYTVNGISYKPDSYDPSDPDYRIELSPVKEALTDRILTLMYVTDANTPTPVLDPQPIETDELMGAIILNKALLFAKDKGVIDGKITVNTEKCDALDYYVAGLIPGEWQIRVDGEPYTKAISKDTDGIIRFTAPGGNITLEAM